MAVNNSPFFGVIVVVLIAAVASGIGWAASLVAAALGHDGDVPWQSGVVTGLLADVVGT